MNATIAAEQKTSSADSIELEALNRDYIRSVQASDVDWFERNISSDFVCCRPDGSLLDRTQFLKFTAVPVAFSNLEVHEVLIRVLGDFALIHARTTYSRPDGHTGSSRYTDTWARQQGRWVAVGAHITPVR
jgi:ketosteroid isomerase-like protein